MSRNMACQRESDVSSGWNDVARMWPWRAATQTSRSPEEDPLRFFLAGSKASTCGAASRDGADVTDARASQVGPRFRIAGARMNTAGAASGVFASAPKEKERPD